MENRERTYSGWWPSQLLPWIQNQDMKKLVAFALGLEWSLSHVNWLKTKYIVDFPKVSLLLSGTAVLLSLEILEVSQFEIFVGLLILGLIGYFCLIVVDVQGLFIPLQFQSQFGIQIMQKLLIILMFILLSIQVSTYNMFPRILNFEILTLLLCRLILTTLDPPWY